MLKIAGESRKWWILIAMGAGGGLILLDETVVGVALPTIRRDLGMGEVASHWVVNAYLLVFAGFAAAGGKIADHIGLKTVFLSSLAIFGVAALAAGFAQDGAFLIAARAVQGLGAAAIYPTSIAMVTIAFPKEQRGMAIGICATIATTLLAAGPLVGGFLTEIVSWRWIFWINVPIAVVIALIVLAAWVDPPREDPRPRLDYGGLVALVVGLGTLVFAIMQGATWGWTQPIILASLACGVVVLAAFVLIERRHDAPLIEVDLFRSATFSACSLVIFAAQFGKIIVVVFGALYLQDEVGMSPLVAGLALLVSVGGMPFTAGLAGRLSDRFGPRRPSLAGAALTSLGMFWIAGASAWDSYALLVPGLVVWGGALTLSFIPPIMALMNAVPVKEQGQAGGIVTSARLLGGTIGVAVGSTLLATTGSFQVVFLVPAGLLLAALVLAWFAIEHQHRARPVPAPGLHP